MSNEEHLLLPISKPKAGVSGKTGTWRTFRPVINKDKCVKCALCYLACPEASIIMKSKAEPPKIDYNYCKGCLVCVSVCAVKAITVERERGE